VPSSPLPFPPRHRRREAGGKTGIQEVDEKDEEITGDDEAGLTMRPAFRLWL
jgi:hypothetical protein